MKLVPFTFAGLCAAGAGAEVLGYGNDYGGHSGGKYGGSDYSETGYDGGYERDTGYPRDNDYTASYAQFGQGQHEISYDDSSAHEAKSHPFIDAWFTFNNKGKRTEAVEHTAVRVSIEEGKNDIIVLEHIFEDVDDFNAANSKRYNTNCATKDLTNYGHDEDHGYMNNYDNSMYGGNYGNRYDVPHMNNNVVDRCVHEYDIGIELAAGQSSRKYSKDTAYPKNEPSTIAVPSYGKLPVDVPSVKMTCVEINDKADSDGAWAIWTDDRSVSLKSDYGGSKYGHSTAHNARSRRVQFNGFQDNTMNQHIQPPVFVNTDNEACWAARGSPKTQNVGTCQAFVDGSNLDDRADSLKVTGDIYSTLPCIPAKTTGLTDSDSDFEVDGCPAAFTKPVVEMAGDACTGGFDCYADTFKGFTNNQPCRDCTGRNDPNNVSNNPTFYKKILVSEDAVQGPIQCKQACLDAGFLCVAAEWGPNTGAAMPANTNCELFFGSRDQNNQITVGTASGFQCFIREPCATKSYCSAVENLSGCFPGCKPGLPEGNIATNPLVQGADTPLLSGFCGYPHGAECVNKPRSLKCTAVIEIGVKSTVDYSSSRNYKLEKED